MKYYIKRELNDRELLLKILFFIVLAVFPCIGIINYAQESTFGTLLYSNFGGLGYDSSISGFFYWFCPQAYLMYITCDFIRKDFDLNGVYMFTRTNDREKWLLSKIYVLLLYTFLFILLNIIIYLITAIISPKIHIVNEPILWYALRDIFLLYGLSTFVFILFLNIMTFYMKSDYSYIIVCLIHFISVCLSQGVIELYRYQIINLLWTIPLFPTNQAMIFKHNLISSIELFGPYGSPLHYKLKYFNHIWTLLYNSIFIFTLIKIGLKKIKSMDIISN